MSAIAVIEYIAIGRDSRTHHDTPQTNLTAQILQTLQRLGSLDDNEQHSKSRLISLELLQSMDKENSKHSNLDTQNPFSNDVALAAFWGFRSYLQSSMSSHSFSDEQRDDLFRHALIGLYRGDRHACYAILSTIQLLSQNGPMPTGRTTSWTSFGTHRGWRESPWGVFFLEVCYICTRGIKVVPHLGQLASGLIRDFLSQGADPNTRISLGLSIEDYDSGSTVLLMDQSPLSCLQCVSPISEQDLSDIRACLESAGAVSYRRFRFLNTYDGYHPIFHRISLSQSDWLNEEMGEDVGNWGYYSEWDNVETLFVIFKTESYRKIFEDISHSDKLDWKVVNEEWRRGGSDWLEDTGS